MSLMWKYAIYTMPLNGLMVNRRFGSPGRVSVCVGGNPYNVGKLAVRQPEKVRARSLAISNLEHDALWHAAGQLDGNAAARHPNLDWRKDPRPENLFLTL